MPSWVKRFAKQASNVLVLAVIGAIGFWGHKTHWKLGAHEADHAAVEHATAHGEPAKAAEAAPPPALAEAKQPAENVLEFETPAAIERAGVQTATAVNREMDEFIECNGSVDYDWTQVAQLTSRAPGVVWRVERRLGEWVGPGDVLVIVEAPAVGEAKADLLLALAEVELREKILARLDPAVVARKQIQEAEAELRAARIRLFNDQQHLINLGLPVRIEPLYEMSDAERARYVQFLGLPESIKSNLDPESTTANLIPLIAPFSGVVIGHEIALGEAVASDKPQLEVADVRQMWVSLFVRQEDSIRLSIGQPVSFTPDGSPLDVHSEISWISTDVDPKTRTVSVRARVENPVLQSSGENSGEQRLLRANTFGKGRIRVKANPSAVVVPSQAVQWDGEKYVVFVQLNDRAFERRIVTLGVSHADGAEILEGVKPDEVVVSLGSHLLKAEFARREADEQN